VAWTLNYTPSYLDNGRTISCIVTAQGANSVKITKTAQPLAITGIKIVESECSDKQYATVDDLDKTIVSCLFFASTLDKTKLSFETSKDPVIADGEAPQQTVVEGAGELAPDQKVVVTSLPSSSDVYSLELQENVNGISGLYKANLKVKQVRKFDMKDYKITVKNSKAGQGQESQRTIKVLPDAVLKGMSVAGEVNNAASSRHSRFLTFMPHLFSIAAALLVALAL
jgi:hypothetical protein